MDLRFYTRKDTASLWNPSPQTARNVTLWSIKKINKQISDFESSKSYGSRKDGLITAFNLTATAVGYFVFRSNLYIVLR